MVHAPEFTILLLILLLSILGLRLDAFLEDQQTQVKAR